MDINPSGIIQPRFQLNELDPPITESMGEFRCPCPFSVSWLEYLTQFPLTKVLLAESVKK